VFVGRKVAFGERRGIPRAQCVGRISRAQENGSEGAEKKRKQPEKLFVNEGIGGSHNTRWNFQEVLGRRKSEGDPAIMCKFR